MAPKNLYRRWDTTHYLNEHASSGMQAHNEAVRSAEAGSRQLRQATESLFRKWEQEHGFVPGAGRILVPAGYRE